MFLEISSNVLPMYTGLGLDCLSIPESFGPVLVLIQSVDYDSVNVGLSLTLMHSGRLQMCLEKPDGRREILAHHFKMSCELDPL